CQRVVHVATAAINRTERLGGVEITFPQWLGKRLARGEIERQYGEEFEDDTMAAHRASGKRLSDNVIEVEARGKDFTKRFMRIKPEDLDAYLAMVLPLGDEDQDDWGCRIEATWTDQTEHARLLKFGRARLLVDRAARGEKTRDRMVAALTSGTRRDLEPFATPEVPVEDILELKDVTKELRGNPSKVFCD
ncbi:MAG: hypothetical protein RL291_1671, partial [Pseudomonadota bacterium]